MESLDSLDVEGLRLCGQSNAGLAIASIPRIPRHKLGEMFLKGPIPMDWWRAASLHSGKVLAVGVVIWYLVGLKKTNKVRITSKELRLLNVGRKAFYQALRKLQIAGLIVVVERRRGACPIVSLRSPSDDGCKPPDDLPRIVDSKRPNLPTTVAHGKRGENVA